jgi:hypothetical protein
MQRPPAPSHSLIEPCPQNHLQAIYPKEPLTLLGYGAGAGWAKLPLRNPQVLSGQPPFSPDLRDRVRRLERVVLELMTAKGKPGGSFQGVKLRPADPPKFGDGKEVIKDWLDTMVQWFGSGDCGPGGESSPCADLPHWRSCQPLEG